MALIQRPSHNEADVPLLKDWRKAVTMRINNLITDVTNLLSERYNKTFGDPTELTIASGVITITRPYHTVDTEADAGTDDVDTINGGTSGGLLVLRAHEDARTVVLKNGTGNLRLGADITLDSREDSAVLLYVTSLSVWVKISSSNNA